MCVCVCACVCVCVCVLYYKFILYITRGTPNKAVKKKLNISAKISRNVQKLLHLVHLCSFVDSMNLWLKSRFCHKRVVVSSFFEGHEKRIRNHFLFHEVIASAPSFRACPFPANAF